MEQNPQSQLKLLIAQGKEQGYLTYAEVNDHLPEELIDTDQIEDIIQMINDMGIQVLDVAPDADDLMLNENMWWKKPPKYYQVWKQRSVAPLIPYGCICVKWVVWNY